ncbi:MAG: hypothetical protein M3512_06635, partial [Bacteroidota bacterium]|nr:hypothetical protein [Bacteroidota bacterium]
FYDAPYEVNKLFVHFQPLYGELFVTNVNVGFGLEVNYYLTDKFDFTAHARKAYGKSFDFERNVASQMSQVDNTPEIFNYYEAGATYHIVDKEHDTETKVVLYSSRFKGNKWAARVPEHIKVPSKVRKVTGVRLGGIAYNSSTDLSRVLKSQEVALVDINENSLDSKTRVYGNVDVMGLYVGGSMAWIKNFAIKPDRGYGVLVNDLIFTTFFDIIVAPSVKVENIFLNQVEYSTSSVKKNILGVRAGFTGKFNRELGWGYGAEMGYRPGIRGRGFFSAVKISFPIYSTNIEHKKEAFGK